MESRIVVRMNGGDAHYGGNLVSAARCMELFGDAATQLVIQNDGDEGLLAGYESVEFLAPIYVGDFIEVVGTIESVGNRSRRCRFEAHKLIAADPQDGDSKATYLEQPMLVARGVGTVVVPEARRSRLNERGLRRMDRG